MKMEKIEEMHEIAETMIRYGGSFVECLGKALMKADLDNTRKIKKAFPKYWATYSDMARLERETNQKKIENAFKKEGMNPMVLKKCRDCGLLLYISSELGRCKKCQEEYEEYHAEEEQREIQEVKKNV